MKEGKIKLSIIKAAKALLKSTPIILGTILLVSLTALIPSSFYAKVFTKGLALNSIIGALIGSISAGNPITSYILGGEFLNQGVNLLVITAFLVAWVTVGIVQLPAESALLGKKFAILRNLTSFVLAILVAIITILLLGVLK